jgi:UTP--glucose-1-phosphate uridylyltransferase
MKIRKAVVPAGGWGTRLLPATKALPKESLPLVNKPIIQWVVEEAVASGIHQVIIITNSLKRPMEDHFDRSFELEYVLARRGDTKMLEEIRRITDLASIAYLRQKEQLGLGHAILVAKDLVGDEPFAVFLPDDIIDAPVPAMKQMLQVFERYKCSVIAIERVDPEATSRYGIISPKPIAHRVYQVQDLVEKPDPAEAPSNLAIVGRYILTPEIFEYLERTPPGRGGEVQLTDGLKLLLERQAIYGYEFEGVRHDAGTPIGLIKATISLGLKDPEIGPELREFLRSLPIGASEPAGRSPK